MKTFYQARSLKGNSPLFQSAYDCILYTQKNRFFHEILEYNHNGVIVSVLTKRQGIWQQ
jgi:hypothetical protein